MELPVRPCVEIKECYDFDLHPSGAILVAGLARGLYFFEVKPAEIQECHYLPGCYPSLRFNPNSDFLSVIRWGGESGRHVLLTWMVAREEAGLALTEVSRLSFRAPYRARIGAFYGPTTLSIVHFEDTTTLVDILDGSWCAIPGNPGNRSVMETNPPISGGSWSFVLEREILWIFRFGRS